MTSLSGLQSGDFTDIDVLYTINLNGDSGDNEQVITSDGTNSSWSDISGLISFSRLNADGSTISIGGSTSGHYDTTATKTIAVAKVPNALTAGTNITYSSGTTYDGSAAITINSTDTNTTYTAGDGLDLSGTEFSTDLKSGSGLTITSGELDLSSIPNSALANSTISGVSLGSNLSNLTAGTNVSFSSGSTYNGSSAITINTTDTNTTYAGGNNISIDATPNPDEIDLDPAITGMTGITYTGGSTTLTGGGGAGDETIATYIDLTSATNLMPLLYPEKVKPYLVFDVYDPDSLGSVALTTSYAEIFSGNLSNTFTAQTTAVLVELQIFNAVYTTGRYTYLGLWDDDGAEWSGGDEADGGGYGTGTENTQRVWCIADETDKRTIQASWYLQGLTIGTSYTINPTAKTNGTTNYIFAGGGDGLYPACILKVSNI